MDEDDFNSLFISGNDNDSGIPIVTDNKNCAPVDIHPMKRRKLRKLEGMFKKLNMTSAALDLPHAVRIPRKLSWIKRFDMKTQEFLLECHKILVHERMAPGGLVEDKWANPI